MQQPNEMKMKFCFVQVLTFTSDGTVKQNMQTISMPYQSGLSKNSSDKYCVKEFHLIYDTCFLFLHVYTCDI